MSQFVITALGNAAASAATPTGPWVNIVQFRIGSDFATPASILDTDLKGTTLYTAAPISYSLIDTDTVGIRCELPATAGPFSFGEIGLYLPGNILFARASFGTVQQKLTGSLAGIPNAWRFTAVIKFSQAPALFNLTVGSQNQILELGDFSLLSSPGTMLGSPNAVIVHEPNPWGEDVFLWKTSSNKWSIGKYSFHSSGAATSGTTTTLTSPIFAQLTSALTRQYLVQFANGDIRGILGVVGNTATFSRPRAAAVAGDSIEIYRADAPAFSQPKLSASDYNSLVNLFNFTWGTPSGSTPSTAHGWGQADLPLTPLGVTPTTWSFLVSKVNKACDLLGIPNNFPLATLQSDWSTDLASQSSQYAILTNLVQLIRNSALAAIPIEKTDVAVGALKTRTTNYTQIHHDVSITFTSATHANSFFNSGGWVGFKIDLDEDNMVQGLQKWRLAQLGVIRMMADRSESTGSMKLVTKTGDGTISSTGNAGFYGRSATRQKLWTDMLPIGTQPGTGIDTGYVLFEMYGTLVSSTVLNLEFWITDTSGAVYSNATNSPPPSIRSTFSTGIPNATILDSPVMAQPSVATLPSTSW